MANVLVRLTDRDGVDLIDSVELTKRIPANGISIDGDKIVGLENMRMDAKRAKVSISQRSFLERDQVMQDLRTLLFNPTLCLPDEMNVEYVNVMKFSHDKIMEVFSENRLFYRSVNSMTQTWETGSVYGRLYIQSRFMHGVFYQILYRLFNSELRYTSSVATLCFGILKLIGLTPTCDFTTSNGHSTLTSDVMEAKFRAYFTSFDNNQLPTAISSALYTFFKYYMLDHVSISANGVMVLANAIASDAVIDEFSYPSETDTTEDVISKFTGTLTTKQACWQVAGLLSSIIKYEDYVTIKNAFTANGGKLREGNSATTFDYRDTQLNITPSRYRRNLFSDSTELVYSRNVQTATIETINSGKEIFNRFIDEVIEPTQIPVCTKNPTTNKLIQIGKTQTRTYLDETDSGLQIIYTPSVTSIYNALFTPVLRTFRFQDYEENVDIDDDSSALNYSVPGHITSQSYKFLLENTNSQSLFQDSSGECIFSLTVFNNDSWMYYDNIVCREREINTEDEIDVDNIPLFDGNLIDEYGVYLYADYFDKYYTKRISSLMDIYLEIYLDNVRVFVGCVDYKSISHGYNDSINIEAVDAIGMLIENIQKLESIVSFTQYDIGDQTTGDLRAGSSVKNVIESIIKQGFPYKSRLINPSFSFDSGAIGISNKLLEDISAEDALLMAVQCSKKLMYADGNGKIKLIDILDGDTATIDGDILSVSESNDLDADVFDISKLKKFAGWNKFAGMVASVYNSLRNRYSNKRDITLRNQTSEIKLLDKITIDNEIYIVIDKNVEIRS